MNPQKLNRRILFLFSDTGGGHRSAAEAIIEAIHLEYPDEEFQIEMIDILREYGTLLFKYAPAQYPYMVKAPQMWGLGYRLTNGPRRVRAVSDMLWPYIRRSMHRLLADHPSDIIVSVHPLPNMPLLRAMGKRKTLYSTVVLDMVTTHASWYDRRADLVIVPTQPAFERGLHYGMPAEKMEIIGMPVADRFCQPMGDRLSLRKGLEWPVNKPTILIVGGGEGMGPLESVVKAICNLGLDINLVVVSGRNKQLRQHLQSVEWNIPVKVYGFVREMPKFMRAADVLITKAGPGTISEGFIAGLPLILYHRLLGQETGNVDYVVDNGAGVWAPEPDRIATVLRNWLNDPVILKRFAEASAHLARPQAARQIARRLVEFTI